MLSTESINSNSKNIDVKNTLEILHIMNEEDRKVAEAISKELPAIGKLIDAVTDVFRRGGRLFYIGAGTSGRLGVLDASECPPTFGVPSSMVIGIIAGGDTALRNAVENAEDNKANGKKDLECHGFTSNDAVVGLSAAGSAPYVVGALEYATSIGAVTGCIVCNENSLMSHIVSFPVSVVVGPEIIQGSTRLKSGTAEKMVLNMITTVSMIKLGLVYDNMMVNLQPTNSKLIHRANTIIQKITGCDEAKASEYYTKTKGKVPEAVLMIMFGIPEAEAHNILKKNNSNLHKAMDECRNSLHLEFLV